MQCAACSEQLGGAAATSPSHAWCEVVVCATCGATNWRCALCMRGGRHKARKLQPGVAGAYAQGRWWGKHAASPAHTARDTERRARLAAAADKFWQLMVTVASATAAGWRAAVSRHGDHGLTDVQDARYLQAGGGMHAAKTHCVRCREPLLAPGGRRFNTAVAPTGLVLCCTETSCRFAVCPACAGGAGTAGKRGRGTARARGGRTRRTRARRG